MGKYKLIALGLILSLGATVGLATVSQAQWSDSVRGQDKVTVAVGETHSGSLYAAGDQVVIDGKVEGDLYCATRELIISDDAEVTGDVLCAVQTATIDGRVGQNARLAGQYLNIDNSIGGSVTFFGQDLKLRADSSVAGDVNGAGQIFNLGGPVGGDVVVAVERLSLQSTVAGNVDVAVMRLELTGGAQVEGNLNYAAENAASFDQTKVAGEVSFNDSTASNQTQGNSFGWLVWLLATMLACALALVLLVPHFVERSRAMATRKFATVSLIGFAAVFGTPILAIMLMMTVVLLPLGVLLMLAWAGVMLISHGLFAYLLGSLALKSQRNVLIRMAVGVVILFILYAVPLINFFAIIIATVVGSGMAIATLTDGYQSPKYTLDSASVKKPTSKKTK